MIPSVAVTVDGGLVTGVPDRVLAVYAHPDDPDISCGGTLARWAAAGCAVTVVLCTRGEKGSLDPAADPSELAALRTEEGAAADRALALPARSILGFGDGEIDEAQLRATLVGEIRRVRPDVLLCPDPTAVFFGNHYMNHRDHRTVGWAALDAASPAAAAPLYFPEAGPAHQVGAVLMSGTLTVDAWVDVSSTLDAKIAAVTCHRSQLRDDPDAIAAAVRRRGEEAGRQAGVGAAEGFRYLRLAG